jgi:23S rRNA (guanosine2251-2'-O)-methyltransferase
VSGIFAGGFHAVEALLKQRPERVLRLFKADGRSEGRLKKINELALIHAIDIKSSSPDLLDKWVGDVVHQGIVAEIAPGKERSDKELPTFIDNIEGLPFLLVIDQVQDPHNLGACLRTAEAAGVHAVVLPRAHSAPLSPTVRKVASGTADLLDIFRVSNLARALDTLKAKGVWLVGTDDSAETSLYDTDLNIPLAIVMGGEAAGLRKLTREKCDYMATLPMAGSVSSLNVSVATGVCLFEAVRQRG